MAMLVKVLSNEANKHARKEAGDAICCLEIPVKLLHYWYLQQDKRSMLQQLNDSLPGNGKVIKLCESKEKSSLDQRLSYRGSDIASRLRKCTRRKRETLAKSIVITVRRNDVIDVMELEDEVCFLNEKITQYKMEVKQSKELIVELMRKIQRDSDTKFKNKGKGIDEVEERQKRRKVSQLKESCRSALWFSDSFNLDLLSIYFQVKNTDECISIDYQSPKQNNLSDNQVFTINQLLYLLDHFAVSDELYHELSMVFPSLPRSHIVRRVRKHLSENVAIHRLPHPFFGAYRHLSHSLTEALEALIESGILLSTPVEVKIGGDGAPFCRTASFILLSFSFPSLDPSYNTENGIHTFAVLRGTENYEVLRDGLKPVMNEINELIDKGSVVLSNKEVVDVNIFLGGDYKFLLMCMGLNAAHANYACLYCTVHKSKRWDMSVAPEKYEEDMKRTIDLLESWSKEKSAEKRLGVNNPPLVKINLKQIIPDELHLFLRVSDVLIRNIISSAVGQDCHITTSTDTSLQLLLEKIRSCGITFNVWKHKEKRDSYEWTSLRGSDRKILFEKFPPHIPDVIRGTDGTTLQKIWEEFYLIYNLIKSTCDHSVIQDKAKQWVQLFLSIKSDGHQCSNVTPYMHLMVYHIPQLMKAHGNIHRFSGQGLEKNNDCARRNYYSNNHLDPPKEILVTDARIHQLAKYKREKRPYNKKDEDYWQHKISSKRAHLMTEVEVQEAEEEGC